MDDRLCQIYDTYGDDTGPPMPWMLDLEHLLGYTFHKKRILVEAVTHPSMEMDYESMSYQRLEFLGDAVLDVIIVDELWYHGEEKAGRQLSHIEMHNYKSAVVNSDLLAYLCMEMKTSVTASKVQTVGSDEFAVVDDGVRDINLWRFLRTLAPQVQLSLQKSLHKRDMLKTSIIEQLDPELEDSLLLDYSRRPLYPWLTLAGLEADKTLSDMIESIIAAVFIDSRGNTEVVKQLVDRFGIFSILHKLLQKNVDPLHPVCLYLAVTITIPDPVALPKY